MPPKEMFTPVLKYKNIPKIRFNSLELFQYPLIKI